jgi:tetratricopeptide (TPR) repeat protein
MVPFVGRQSELSQLHQAFRAITSAQKTQFLFIQGEFGVGKTALVERFLEEVTAQQAMALIGRSKCSMETELNGLIPFVQLLVNLTEQNNRRHVVPGSVLDFLKEVAPAWIDIFFAGVGSALSKTIEQGQKLIRGVAFSQDQVFMQFTNVMKKLSKEIPLIVFIDDLQWADESSLRLLFHLARSLEEGAILFICAYRPVEALETGRNQSLFRDIRVNLKRYNMSEMELRKGIDVQQYIHQRYPLNSFPSDLSAYVRSMTEGHALFLSQLFSLWEETHIITPVPDPKGQPIWGLVQNINTEETITQTLGEVLEERARLMQAELREILPYASVEGEDFTAQVVGHLLKFDELKVSEHLETLEQRYRLVQIQGTKEVETTVLDFYRFAHRFFREYTYNHLSAPRRRILHRQVGECLEALYHDRRPIAGQLAMHFKKGQLPLKSAQYALMAAEFEQSHYAWAEAELWCAFGRDALADSPESREASHLLLDLLEQSANGYYDSGNYTYADGQYREALRLAQLISVDVTRIANITYKLASVCDEEGKTEEAISLLKQGKQLLDAHALPYTEVHFNLDSVLAYEQGTLGNSIFGIEQLQTALEQSKQLDRTPTLQRSQVEAYTMLGTMLAYANRYQESIISYKHAIDLAHDIGYKGFEAACWMHTADVHLNLGNPDLAFTCVDTGLVLAVQSGDIDDEAYGHAIRGGIFNAVAKPREAAEDLMRAIAIMERVGSLENSPYVLADLALADLALADLDNAYRHATQGVGYAEGSSRSVDEGYALEALARVEAARGELDSAAQHFRQAMSTYQDAGNRHFVARSQRRLAEVQAQQGNRSGAIELLDMAMETFERLDLSHEILQTRQLLDAWRAQE